MSDLSKALAGYIREKFMWAVTGVVPNELAPEGYDIVDSTDQSLILRFPNRYGTDRYFTIKVIEHREGTF